MASRNVEKVKFPVIDMLRNEQEEEKNRSVEKDDFSEVVKEDFKKILLLRFSSLKTQSGTLEGTSSGSCVTTFWQKNPISFICFDNRTAISSPF